MMQQTIWAPDNGSGSPWQVTQDYTYDAVDRLATAAEELSSVTQWSRTYRYDHFGNRWISGATGHTLHMATPTSSSDIQATTNRLTGTGITYDNAGNLTAHPNITPGSGSMAYDANNQMTTFVATGVSVATNYDAAGRRVRKAHNSETTVWVYDATGKLAAEYATETQTDDATYFRTTDRLGSTRLTTDEVGDVVARRDYFPFGERIGSTLSGRDSVTDGTLASFSASPGMRQRFTSQQRDSETGLDYFWERKYFPAIGQFLSVDPENRGFNAAVGVSLNGYSTAWNSPLILIDRNGEDPVYFLHPLNCVWYAPRPSPRVPDLDSPQAAINSAPDAIAAAVQRAQIALEVRSLVLARPAVAPPPSPNPPSPGSVSLPAPNWNVTDIPIYSLPPELQALGVGYVIIINVLNLQPVIDAVVAGDVPYADIEGVDKYFHCKVSCEGSQLGLVGAACTLEAGTLRELGNFLLTGDDVAERMEGMAANASGIDAALEDPNVDCKQACEQFRPPGLPAQY